MSIEEWLSTRPQCVQRLAREFPLGSTFVIDDAFYYLVGYTEDDTLIITHINPDDHYDEAVKNRKYVCADHFRDSPEEDTQSGEESR